MKLLTIDSQDHGTAGALLSDGQIVDLHRARQSGTVEQWLPASLIDILRAGHDGLDVVRRIVARVDALPAKSKQQLRATGAIIAADQGPWGAPVPAPALMLSIGQAYRAHLDEMKGKYPAEPHAFIKASSSVVGHKVDIPLPSTAPDMVDFEGELCAIFGRTCHNVSADDAMDYIAGYTIGNDVSARDWAPLVGRATTTSEARTAWDLNHMGKQFPAFAPLGPVLVTKDEIPDPHALTLTTRLNGQVMQHTSTDDMIFRLQETIAYFSRWFTFQPGDVLSTGTPGGVGFARKPPVFLKPGDVVEVEIEKIGILSNRFV